MFFHHPSFHVQNQLAHQAWHQALPRTPLEIALGSVGSHSSRKIREYF